MTGYVLHVLAPNGIPSHKLLLSVGMHVVLFRNLSPSQGLCKGTCLCIKNLQQWVIEADIFDGTHID